MADVVLNLIYNDNGAKASIDSLYQELQKMEQKQWHINLGNINTSYISQIESAAKKFESAYAMLSAPNGSGLGRTKASFQELEQLIDRLNTKIKSNRLSLLDAFAAGNSEEVTRQKNSIAELESELSRVQKAFDRISTATSVQEFLKLKDAIVEMQSALYASPAEVQKIAETNAHNSAQAFYEELFGSHATSDEVQQIQQANARRVAEAMYRRLFDEAIAKEEARKSAEAATKETVEQIKRANNEISQGHHQTWRGIQQTIAGVINTITSAYNTFKSVIEAPLNLTGVSQFASMIESMEGSLLLNQISSNITGGFANSVERFDILQTFPTVMEAIGFSSDQSTDSMNRLYQSVLGLPTAFEDVVSVAQYFALVLGDIDKATDLAIAANNAFVASGATSQQITSGMRQLQYLIDGTKLRSTQWYSLIRAMPVALREVGVALGYPDFSSFTADLMAGKVATDDLIDSLIDVGLHSEKIAGVVDVMKTRVQAALDNVRNAAKRMGNAMLEALDETLKRTGGKGIAENIKGVSKILDHISEVSAEWINKNGDKLQALIDKFMKIDWASIIPKLFDGLAEFADKALDNINEFLDKIPGLLTTVRQTFNDLENNPLVKLLTGGGSVISGASQVAAGIANIVAGVKLSAAGNAALAKLGVTSGEVSSIVGGSTAVASGSNAVLGALGSIGGLVAGILAIMKLNDAMENESDEFRNDPETQNLIRGLVREYISELNKVSSGEYVPEAFWNAKNLSERISSYTNGAISLPMFSDYGNATVEDILSAISMARGYYNYGIEDFERLFQQRAEEDMLGAEYESFRSSVMSLYDSISKAWDRFDNASVQYTDKLAEIDYTRSRIQAQIDEIEKKGISWEIRTTSNFASIYGGTNGKEGKYFSEKVKEAFGGLFRNTTSDFAKVQEELSPQITQLNREMTKAIDNYDLPDAEKSQLYEAWANALSGINPEDPESVAQLETMIKEGPDKLITTYLIPLMKSNEALNANKQALYDARLEALGLAGEDLDKQAEYIEEKMAEDPLLNGIMEGLTKEAQRFSELYLPAINRGLISFGDDIRKSIQHLIDSINSWSFVAHPKVKVQPVNVNTNYYRGDETLYSATGGFMFAPHGTDTIPAMLTPGEYVQRRAAVEHFGRMFMDRINALDLRGALRSLQIATPYSNGGFIKNETRNYRDNHATVNQTFNNSSANFGFRRANRFVRALG